MSSAVVTGNVIAAGICCVAEIPQQVHVAPHANMLHIHNSICNIVQSRGILKADQHAVAATVLTFATLQNQLAAFAMLYGD